MHLQTRQSRRTNRMPRKVDKRKTLCTSEFEPVYFKSQKSWQRNKWFQLVANNMHLQTRQARRRINRMPRTVDKRKTLYTSEFGPVYLKSQERFGKETSGFNQQLTICTYRRDKQEELTECPGQYTNGKLCTHQNSNLSISSHKRVLAKKQVASTRRQLSQSVTFQRTTFKWEQVV